MNLDLYLFNLINKFSGKREWLDKLAVFFAVYAGYLMAAFLFVFAYFSQNMAMFFVPFLAGLLSRFIVNEAVYFFYKRKRPPEVLGAKTLIKIPKHPALPSGHASFFFALSFALLPFSFILGIIFVVLSLLVSSSRIFAGVHWPSDILAGMAAGAFSAFFIIKML